MNNEQLIKDFLDSWVDFRVTCEIKARNKARLNKESWRKLMIFHTEKFLSCQENPFGILFSIRYKNPDFYRNYRLNMFYSRYLRARNDLFQRKQDERKSIYG